MLSAPFFARAAAVCSACCALAALCAPSALCAAPPATTQGIRAAYGQINDAFQQRNLNRAMSLFTPDYTLTDDRGRRLDRAQAIQDYRDTMRDVRSMRTRFDLESVTPAPNGSAWAEMKMHSEGTGEKRVLFARVRGTFTNDLHVRDLWVHTPQGWRLKYRQTIQDETHTHPG